MNTQCTVSMYYKHELAKSSPPAVCANTTAADIHAHELGAEAERNEARERATNEAVQTLISSGTVRINEHNDHFTTRHLMEIMAAHDDEEAGIQNMLDDNPAPLRDLYLEEAYKALYPYADYLVTNDSKPF